jgi:hypothetical protein
VGVLLRDSSFLSVVAVAHSHHSLTDRRQSLDLYPTIALSEPCRSGDRAGFRTFSALGEGAPTHGLIWSYSRPRFEKPRFNETIASLSPREQRRRAEMLQQLKPYYQRWYQDWLGAETRPFYVLNSRV